VRTVVVCMIALIGFVIVDHAAENWVSQSLCTAERVEPDTKWRRIDQVRPEPVTPDAVHR